MTCTLCPLHKEALTVCVPGRGNPQAKIMLVGQAPGPKEDCAGESFVGKSGILLDEMLTDAGYTVGDLFFTNAVKCVVGGSAVRFPSTPTIGYRRKHEGSVVEITTAKGGRLTVTPNHPVLTQVGWIAADSLDPAVHQLFHAQGVRWSVPVEPNVYDVPASAEQAFAALKQLGHAKRMICRPMDFHGDVSFNSEVEIVGADSDLRAYLSELAEPGANLPFPNRRRLTASVLAGSSGVPCTYCHRGVALFTSTHGLVCGGCEAKPTGFTELAHAYLPSFANGAPGDSSVVHLPVDFGLAELVANPDSAGRLALGVEAAQIARVDRRSFSGHVYNFSTPEGWYSCNEHFIHNCKPPVEKGTFSERAPMTEEIDACREHLVREIHRVKPDVIIALGDIALRSLTRLSGIGTKRGKSFPLHKSFAYDCEVWPAWHPAYIMRVPVARSTAVADFRRIRDRGMEQTPIRWKWAENIRLRGDFVALDIETIDEESNVCDKPTQIAFASPGDGGALVLRLPGWWEHDEDTRLVHHNGLEFDLPKLGAGPMGYDTMYLAHLLDENQPLGLEPLCVKYLGVRGWKEDEFAPLGSDELAAYNARDAVNTLRLFHKERELLGPRIKIYEQIMLPARLALNECSRRGLWIDGQQVEKMRVKVDADILHHRSRVISIASEWTDVKKFNPNSVQQVAPILVEMGIELPRTRKTGALKVDKGVLQAHPDNAFASALLEYRGATKTKSTYVVPYARAAASGNHRMHNDYTLIRTVVGRTSARKARSPVEGLDPGTNVQNLDRELEFFGAPPGAVFVKADYSALHIRLAAWCANATSILGRYEKNPKWDPHRFFARRFYGINDPRMNEASVTKEQRQVGKSAMFSQLYLGDEHTLQNYAYKMGIELDLATCRALHIAWHATFPEFRPWYQQVWDEVVELGYSETATGRRRNFGDIKLLNRSGRAAAHREAVNEKVLGLEPDITLLGLSACHRAGLPINSFFHDCIGFEFDNLKAFEDNREAIRRAMIEVPLGILRDEFNCDITVPLAIDFTVYDKETT